MELSSRLSRVMLLLLLAMVVGQAVGKLVDIKPYYSLILERHNDLRRTVNPPAADMREMMWDDALAKDAENWSKYCRYNRPPKHVYSWGSNLFYQRKHVRSWHSIRAHATRALQAWEHKKNFFTYSTRCGRSCSYVQMVYSSTYRVGCAMNTCGSLHVSTNMMERESTLFVCFYAPRGRLMSTYPYRSGTTCSQCPIGTRCSGGLCAEGSGVVTSSKPATVIQPQQPITTSTLIPFMSADKLTANEEYYLVQLQNQFRADDGCSNLVWDPKLKLWTDWIVNCKTDYPGPPHAYTSFYRCADHMPMYEAVREWAQEGRDTNIRMRKGCRSPWDRSPCNHYTNMMQPRVTSMACSACNCGDGTRQLVCVYDNHNERRHRGYKK